MKTLLYATDCSDNSVNALHFSAYLAKTLNTQCMAMHVFDFSALASTVSLAYARQERSRRVKEKAKLRRFCEDHLPADAAGIQWSYRVVEGRQAWECILVIAEELKADFIVVGSKGGNPLRTMLQASTASALIDRAGCAVIVVPETDFYIPIRNIVYASAMEEADIQALQWLIPMAGQWNANLEVVHIVTSREYKGEDQMEWFKEMVLKSVHYKKLGFRLLYSDDVPACLKEYLEESQASLLVMMERKDKNAWESLWHPDVVIRMQNELRIPLLRFHKEYLKNSIAPGTTN